jgi:hypothetical protein
MKRTNGVLPEDEVPIKKVLDPRIGARLLTDPPQGGLQRWIKGEGIRGKMQANPEKKLL